MNSIPSAIRLFAAAGRFCTAVAFSLLLSIPSVFAAQDSGATGTIVGRVYNPTTGEYVRNAEVRLQGTNRLVTTESDGSFRLNNVPSGVATLTVTHAGYATVTDTLDVGAGQTAVRELNLTSTAAGAGSAGDAIRLSEFVVSSEREGNAKAIMQQRRNMNITTSVASDVFGDVAEGNVGEFLKFLPGVDVEYVDAETRGPRLGGMAPEYVGVTIDGAKLASADAFASYNGFINGSAGDGARSVGFEQMSISAIESIEVNRTLSPDMDADSPAGSINLKTRRGFDRKGRRIDWQFSLSANSDDFKWGKTHRPGDGQSRLIRPSSKVDYTDVFLNNRLGISLGLSQSSVLVQQQSVTQTFSKTTTATDPRPVVVTAIGFGDGPKFLDRTGATLTADFKASSRLVLTMSAMYSTYLGSTFSRSMTFTAAGTNTNAATGRTNVLGDGLTEIRTNGLATNTSRTVGISGGQNFAKGTSTLSFIPRFEYTLGPWLVDGTLNYSRSINAYDSFQHGSVRVETVGALPGIDFRATRPNANSPEWTITQTGGPNWADLSLYPNPRVSTDEDRGGYVTIYQADLNVRYTLPLENPTFVKVGFKVNEEYRISWSRNGNNTWSYIGPGGNTVAANGTITTTGSFANFPSPRTFDSVHGPNTSTIVNMPVFPSRQDLAVAVSEHPEWFRSLSTAETYYTAYYGNARDFKQAVPAVYGMANTRIGKWQFQGGLRWERTETTAKDFDPLTAPEVQAAGYAVSATTHRATTIPGIDYQFGSQPRVKHTGEYDNFFPSVSAKYSILPNLQAQVGYSHAISRAPINALAGVWSVNDIEMTVSAPNPQLLPEISDNYVARLAYYFEPVGSLTFLVQQNEIKNRRIDVQMTAGAFGITDDPAYANYTFETTINGTELFRFRNLELAYSQQLSFLPGPLKNTNFSASYSRTYANQRKPGTLPHKITGGIAWNYWRVNLRLGAIWQSDAQWTTTVGRYQRRNIKFDLSGGVRLTRRTSLFVQGRNILNEPRQLFDENIGGVPAMLQGSFNYGTSWVFGVKGNF